MASGAAARIARSKSGVMEFSDASERRQGQSSGRARIARIRSRIAGDILVRAEQTSKRFSGQTASFAGRGMQGSAGWRWEILRYLNGRYREFLWCGGKPCAAPSSSGAGTAYECESMRVMKAGTTLEIERLARE